MKINRYSLIAYALIGILLVTGCGQKNAATAGQSFGSASDTASVIGAPAVPTAAPAATPTATPAATSAASAAAPSAAPAVSPEPAPVTASPPAAPVRESASAAPPASGQPKAAPSTAPAVTSAATPAVKVKPAASPESSKPASTKGNEINWDQFFDDDKQDRPSERFWDMSGKTVQIKGFMGEVLSFDKHWFLLIPKPGAECPFDNGDETYWNKIMIVFVPDDVKLRYTSGPLLITGKLDVGVKLDESGYKTMFRLYDASFEKIKE
ncbi:hypothetical protein ACFPES_16790 [Paenibacillus sp. GCM10023248]|uniref:hypothetical protein n=1 Tax=unclassified Paenibacillus TaxID=185978 RepID=UPI002379431E|nr:hypothetical protein [Paenibacillus sp. MAHUQ-63]MDD9268698.1 hypothetical protein [Paenibacillus sp. MAHUQ-63]